MFNSLKTQLRDLLPKRYQVPAKYWYGSLSDALEEEMKFLALLVKPGDRVIDIGGNRGVYAYRLWGLKAKVEVFEPNPICFRVLETWSANKPEVRLHSVALSNQSGSANLHIPIDGSGVEHDASASIEQTGFTATRDQLVCLQTLDSYQFDNVTFIKIDVEGHEYSVIEGAVGTIASSRPALLIEIEQRHSNRPIEEVLQKITGLGYEGFFLENHQLKALRDFDLRSHQAMENFGGQTGSYINNFLFLHRDRLANGDYAELLRANSFK